MAYIAVVSELWGQRGTLYPLVPPCTPCNSQVKDAAYVKILSKRLQLQDCIRFVQICTPRPLTKTFRRAWYIAHIWIALRIGLCIAPHRVAKSYAVLRQLVLYARKYVIQSGPKTYPCQTRRRCIASSAPGRPAPSARWTRLVTLGYGTRLRLGHDAVNREAGDDAMTSLAAKVSIMCKCDVIHGTGSK